MKKISNSKLLKNNVGVTAMLSRKIQQCFIFVLVLLAAAGVKGAEIKAIDFNVMPGDKVQILIKMDAPPPEFKEITTENPARIWMDLDGVTSGLASKTQNIGIGVTRSISAIEAGGKTRLVVNLVELAPYSVTTDGNNLVMTVGYAQNQKSVAQPAASGAQAPSSAGTQQTVPAPTSRGSHDIANIDFKRGEAGEARVIVELMNANIGIDLRQEGRTIKADFVNASISENFIRKLDVVDFATPAKLISTSRIGNNVRISVDTLDEFEYLAYQAGTTYIIELKPLTPEEVERKRREEPSYSGQKLTLNFQNISVRAVLSMIANFTGINIVTSDTVSGSIGLRLENVPWDQALDIVLKTKGLDKRVNGNVMLIAPADEIAAREALELQNEVQIEQLAPLRSEFIQINYAKAEDLVEIVKTKGANYLSDRGSITVDKRTNHLIVQDTAKKLDQILSMINRLDVPVRQVLIEGRVVVADSGADKELGVRFGVTDNNPDGTVSGTVPGSAAVHATQDLSLRTLAVDLPSPNAAGSIGFTVGRIADGTILDLELSALEKENRGEVIASPRVITANQKEAYIESGEEIPYLTASSAGNTTVTWRKAVLGLTVTPQITPDDRIILDLVVKQDSRGENVLNIGPAINTREVGTQVLVENGETVVLGGVYEQTTNHDVTKVPLLGDIPILGYLFRSTVDGSTKRELLMFVTPKIVKQSVR